MARGTNWSKDQDERTVAAYFAMWARIRAGEPVNKNATYRSVGSDIGREWGAVSRKFQNISAVLEEFGAREWAPGLKPNRNFQDLLADAVIEWLDGHPDWFADLVPQQLEPVNRPEAWAVGSEEPPPSSQSPLVVSMAKVSAGRSPRILDFIELQQRSRDLGVKGEEFIVEHERRWLHDVARAPELARRVEWVSQTQGDGLGFDISSFGGDGSPRLIEVKTTTLGKCTPFFLSRNELAVSRREAARFQLYRVFDFNARPRFFRLPGPVDQSCRLEPQSFIARVG